QDKANQTDGLWLPRYRLLLFKDKSGFPRKAAMNLFLLPRQADRVSAAFVPEYRLVSDTVT
ncbi:hypothetical protein KW504_20860, partial [Vibrio fluvialis]|nr:hypothetical protein [Vibrio fluvialis]